MARLFQTREILSRTRKGNSAMANRKGQLELFNALAQELGNKEKAEIVAAIKQELVRIRWRDQVALGLKFTLKSNEANPDMQWTAVLDHVKNHGLDAIRESVSNQLLALARRERAENKIDNAVRYLITCIQLNNNISYGNRIAGLLDELAQCRAQQKQYVVALGLMILAKHKTSFYETQIEQHRKDLCDSYLAAAIRDSESLAELKEYANTEKKTYVKKLIQKSLGGEVGITMMVTGSTIIALPVTVGVLLGGLSHSLFRAATRKHLSPRKQKDLIDNLHAITQDKSLQKKFIEAIRKEYSKTRSMISSSNSSNLLYQTVLKSPLADTEKSINAIMVYMLSPNKNGDLFVNNGKRLFRIIAEACEPENLNKLKKLSLST